MMHLLRKYDVAPLRSAMRRCLPPNVAKPRIIREANIIRWSCHHLPKANIIQKSLICLVDKLGFFVGGETGIYEPMFAPIGIRPVFLSCANHAYRSAKALLMRGFKWCTFTIKKRYHRECGGISFLWRRDRDLWTHVCAKGHPPRFLVLRKPCISRCEGTAYARVQMVYFHDKKEIPPRMRWYLFFMAERQGFEPWYPVRGNTISSRAP